jgi:tRNA G10  N-methylase Trm11
MKYCFILGNNPTLSIAELSSIFNLDMKKDELPNGDLVANNIFILETNKKIDAAKLIKEIGGTVKIGLIGSISAGTDKISLLEGAKKIIKTDGGKFYFGISNYTKQKINIKALGMEIKKYLRNKKISSRWVTSREETLSSVVVEQNKLISRGIEIILMERDGKILIGETLAVQPFKELSSRDYGRPARDDYSGMLPPKLAQVMINLALSPSPYEEPAPSLPREEGRGEVKILDPFCGSGTILTEAMLMGFRNIIGSDISKKAVEDTKKNMEWIIKNYELRIMNYELFNKSALELSRFVKPNSVDAIVTEPYLGPQRGKIDFNKVKKELENLYSKSLIEFKKILKDKGRVVMVWPVFHMAHNMENITPNLNEFKISNPIPENLRNNKLIKLTNRNTIIYGRPRQKIWREIAVLKKIIYPAP